MVAPFLGGVDVDCDVFRYFPPKKGRRTDETFRLDIGHCGLVQKKIEKKRDEKSSLTSDKNLEAEKERLPKSHEANCFSLSLLLVTLIFLSLRDDPPNPHFIPHIMATFSAAKVC